MARIFVAVFASSSLQEKIAVWIKQFNSAQSKTASHIRWLPRENLHLTLVPPWCAEEKEIEVLKEQLSKSLTIKPFSLNFKTISFGSKPRSPRLIWVSAEACEAFGQLQKEALALVGQKPEKRELKIHLTIGRFKPEDFKTFSLKELNETIDWQEKVEKVCLVKSELLQGGAKYSPLARFPL